MARKKSTKFAADNERIRELLERALGQPVAMTQDVLGIGRFGLTPERPLWRAWFTARGRHLMVFGAQAHDRESNAASVDVDQLERELAPVLYGIVLNSLAGFQASVQALVQRQGEVLADVISLKPGH